LRAGLIEMVRVEVFPEPKNKYQRTR
jgi:hypothetical protein